MTDGHGKPGFERDCEQVAQEQPGDDTPATRTEKQQEQAGSIASLSGRLSLLLSGPVKTQAESMLADRLADSNLFRKGPYVKHMRCSVIWRPLFLRWCSNIVDGADTLAVEDFSRRSGYLFKSERPVSPAIV